MQTIIAAHFADMTHLHEATAGLAAQGVASQDYATYYLNPPGQQGLYRLDRQAAGQSDALDAARNASAEVDAGRAARAEVGHADTEVGALAATSVSAYVGALTEAMWGTLAPDHARQGPDEAARGGPTVAVRVENADDEAAVVSILKRCNARQIDRTHGHWQDGHWADVDPQAPGTRLLGAGGAR